MPRFSGREKIPVKLLRDIRKRLDAELKIWRDEIGIGQAQPEDFQRLAAATAAIASDSALIASWAMLEMNKPEAGTLED